jgi:hypothetical protein
MQSRNVKLMALPSGREDRWGMQDPAASAVNPTRLIPAANNPALAAFLSSGRRGAA